MCTKRWKPSDPRRKRRTTESWRLAVRLVELAVVKLENFQVSKARTSQKRGGEASLRRGTRRVRVSQWATLEHFCPPSEGEKGHGYSIQEASLKHSTGPKYRLVLSV